jgi:hypothetical protein
VHVAQGRVKHRERQQHDRVDLLRPASVAQPEHDQGSAATVVPRNSVVSTGGLRMPLDARKAAPPAAVPGVRALR